jgi:hypothetical protein
LAERCGVQRAEAMSRKDHGSAAVSIPRLILKRSRGTHECPEMKTHQASQEHKRQEEISREQPG